MFPCIYVSTYADGHISEHANTIWVVWGMGLVSSSFKNLGKNYNLTILSYIFIYAKVLSNVI
jgi:hypothetical protein